MFGKHGGMKIAAALILTATLAAPAAAGGLAGRAERPPERAARVAPAFAGADWAGLWNRTWGRFVEVLGFFEGTSADGGDPTLTTTSTDSDTSGTSDHGSSIDPNG